MCSLCLCRECAAWLMVNVMEHTFVCEIVSDRHMEHQARLFNDMRVWDVIFNVQTGHNLTLSPAIQWHESLRCHTKHTLCRLLNCFHWFSDKLYGSIKPCREGAAAPIITDSACHLAPFQKFKVKFNSFKIRTNISWKKK